MGEKHEWDIYSLSGEQTAKLPFFRFVNIMRLVFTIFFVALGSTIFYYNSLLSPSVSSDELMRRTANDGLPSLDMVEGMSLLGRPYEMTERDATGLETDGFRQSIAERLDAVLNVYFEGFYETRILHYRDNVLQNIDRLRGKD